MIKTIDQDNLLYLEEAARCFRKAHQPVALTGAGSSVASGIADFRSPGGLWTFFSPEEYATLDVFLNNPEKAWQLYRKLGREILGKKPNKAHRVLAQFESSNLLGGLVTQNVDGLHQAAGSKNVLEIHGNHHYLHCLQCRDTIPVAENHYSLKDIPRCRLCSYPLKPDIVLFGEGVKNFDKIQDLVAACDLLLVIGTSAKVYPAAGIPAMVKQQGGMIYEFNREQVLLRPDCFFKGDLENTLPMFAAAVFNNS